MLVTEAPGAQVKPFRLSVYNDGSGMNVGYPLPIGVAFGVADIVSKLGCLTTYVTFPWHLFPFDQIQILR